MKKILAMLTALALLLAGPGALAEETAPDGGSGPDRTVEIRFGGLAMDWLVTYSYPTDILVPASAFAAAGVSASATWDGGVMLSAGDGHRLRAGGPHGPQPGAAAA